MTIRDQESTLPSSRYSLLAAHDADKRDCNVEEATTLYQLSLISFDVLTTSDLLKKVRNLEPPT